MGRSPEEIVVEYPGLSLADVHSALAYYFDHKDDIHRQIEEDEQFVTAMKAETGPGPLGQKLNRSGDSRAAIRITAKSLAERKKSESVHVNSMY